MDCDVCRLPDPYNGHGDGIGSCDCPRCDGDCGVAVNSVLCECPDDDGYWDAMVDAEGSNEPIEHEPAAVRPSEQPRPITTVHLPEDR